MGHVNRSRKAGLNLYCGRKCTGLAKRRSKTEKVEAKRIYDLAYREKNLARIRAAKAAAYKANPNRERERAYRQANMARHVEYCRRPEYRKRKAAYDQERRAKIFYGPFWEAALALFALEREIDQRMSRHDIYQANGTINKKLNRRREYEKTFSG